MYRALRVENMEPGWEPKLAGCHGLSLLVKYLKYVDYNNIHRVPVAHALLLGLVKDLLNLLLCKSARGEPKPEYALPPAARRAMADRYQGILLTCDFGRPYRCVVNQRGHWVMEDYVNWLEVHSVYILQPYQKVIVVAVAITNLWHTYIIHSSMCWCL